MKNILKEEKAGMQLDERKDRKNEQEIEVGRKRRRRIPKRAAKASKLEKNPTMFHHHPESKGPESPRAQDATEEHYLKQRKIIGEIRHSVKRKLIHRCSNSACYTKQHPRCTLCLQTRP